MLTPQEIGARLRALRDDAHLSEATAAKAAGLTIEELRAMEDGRPAKARVLVQLATVYGLTEVDLIAPEPPTATAVSTLLRGEADKEELALHLGRLAMICREQTELENMLGISARGQITRFPPAGAPTEPAFEQAESLADRVRAALNLGIAPIRSMSQLLGELGIRLIWTDRLSEDIKGLSFNDRRVGPSAVINVSNNARRRAWWSLRSTIAHELCHVLFDRVPTAPFGTVSRRKPNHPIEQRADAFAYYFLAPREEVNRFLRESRGRVPFDLDRNDVQAVANHFAIGVEAATWHLKNLGWISESQRQDLIRFRYPIEPELDPESPWANSALAPFIECGVDLERLGLVLLAVAAHSRGQITEARLRESLDLSPFVDLTPVLGA